MKELERTVMAHRYLYYISNCTVISDIEYDKLEKEALEEVDETSPLHSPGSDLESSYPMHVALKAFQLLRDSQLP